MVRYPPLPILADHPRTITRPMVFRSPGAFNYALSLLSISLIISACDGGGILLPQKQAWVAIEPIQCLGNPWERAWLEKHGNNYGAYPRDLDSQKTIIREYYAHLGIEVDWILSVPKYQVVCDACGCPRGDTLYMLVGEEYTEVMIRLGYRREGPRWTDTLAPGH